MNNPSTLIFLGLAVVWAIVLLPEGIKRLSKIRRSDSIRSFSHQLSALDRSDSSGRVATTRSPFGRSGNGRVNARTGSRSNVIDLRQHRSARQSPPSVPGKAPGREPNHGSVPALAPMAVRRRRQEVIASLSAVAILTLLCGVAFSPTFLVLHLVADVLLIGYLSLVSQANKAAQTNRTHSSGASSYSFRGSAVTRIDANGLTSMPVAAASRSARRSV